MFLSYLAICLFIIFPLLVLFTKMHDNRVDVGSFVFCLIGSVVPLLNIILLAFIFINTMEKRGFWDKVLF